MYKNPIQNSFRFSFLRGIPLLYEVYLYEKSEGERYMSEEAALDNLRK